MKNGILGVVKGCLLVCKGTKFPRLKLLNTNVTALTSHVLVIVTCIVLFFYASHCSIFEGKFTGKHLGESSFKLLGGLK